MKNTLVFILTEGIGLNKRWKGNYLKLVEKPNINYLISGIYPWAIISNTKKIHKKILKKSFPAIKKDTDANFYEMLYGTDKIKTYLGLLNEKIESHELDKLPFFEKLKNRSNETNSKKVHLFALFSNNENKLNINNLFFVINALLINGLTPIIHLITDGQEERPFNFSKNIITFSKFLIKRNTPIATISGRNHVFIKKGHDFKENKHIQNYFETICGISNNFFETPLEYANENLANKVMDADILPAFNNLFKDCFIAKEDSLLFLNSDSDDFSTLAHTIKNNNKFKDIYISSLGKINGVELDNIMFDDPVKDFEQNLLTNLISKNNKNSLVLSLSHKKGFIKKFFGEANDKSTTKKVLKIDYLHEADYYFNASKSLIDSAIDNIGKYDVIFLHCPMIAEAAKTSDLKKLTFAISTFDKNLGRLINYCKSTGNIIALTSAYGAAEKMLDKHLNIVPYNKNSCVPFVFTNGDLSTKKLNSNFFGVYSTVLATLGLLKEKNNQYYASLINNNFTKDKIGNLIKDSYEVWYKQTGYRLTKDFEENRANFYSEFLKDKDFLNEKKQYVALKELIKIHKKTLLTPEARQKIFKIIIDDLNYNKIDFIKDNFNFKKVLETLFDLEVSQQTLSKISNKFFDKKIWKTNYKLNDKWVNSIKFQLSSRFERQAKTLQTPNSKILESAYLNFFPYLFFEKIRKKEIEALETNDAYKIKEFYDDNQKILDDIFKKYVENKVIDFEDEEIEPEKIDEFIKISETSAYYQAFLESIKIVNSEIENFDFYNKKFKEKQEHLKQKNIDYSNLDIFDKPDIALNILTVKLLREYKFVFKNLDNQYQKTIFKHKKTETKYNNSYQNKVNLAHEAKVYEGEFLENIDLLKQKKLKTKFSNYVSLYKEFDFLELVNEKEDSSQIDQTPEYDEDGNLIVVDNVDKNIRYNPESDLTKQWISKRIDEHKNVDNLKLNVTQDAEMHVKDKNQFRFAKKTARHYNLLSESWQKDIKEIINNTKN